MFATKIYWPESYLLNKQEDVWLYSIITHRQHWLYFTSFYENTLLLTYTGQISQVLPCWSFEGFPKMHWASFCDWRGLCRDWGEIRAILQLHGYHSAH